MQVLNRPQKMNIDHGLRRRRGQKRFSPFMFVGVGITLTVILLGAAIVTWTQVASHAAAALNMNCTLVVPANPLSATGLATPYQLVATNANNGPCNEANKGQSAFVQGAVYDPAAHTISIYNPLVIDQGTQPAVVPTAPTLPANAIVALWFGFNGTNLTLQATNNSLNQGNCVNGLNGSIFGQFAYCNAVNFFNATNQAVQNGQLVVPPLGTALDGKACPTVRDFSVVDMDQSDNTTTTYLSNGNGQIAQNTTANAAALQTAAVMAPQMQTNASDNRLLAVALDGTLGCKPWMVADLADPGKMTTGLPLDELQAKNLQGAPVAIVPAGDEMVLVNAQASLTKTTLYRVGVDQTPANANNSNTTTYCMNLRNVQPARLQLDMTLEMNQPSPDPAAANNLFTFMAQRFNTTYGPNGLNCVGLLNMPSPITVTVTNAIATAATINLAANAANANANAAANTTTTTTTANTTTAAANTAKALNCTVNGTQVNACAGNITLNGQAATLAFDTANNQVNVTSAAAANPAANTTQTTANAAAPTPVAAANTTQTTANAATAQTTPPNCAVNGTVVAACTGSTMFNGQPVTFAFDAANNQVNITDATQAATAQNTAAQNTTTQNTTPIHKKHHH